ncbi:hypothetical protein SB659_19925, partial [Arthrobacter sp. SIMBA_036]|uniref:hypothetical protein n=1 Tax=Arthrobacter sp. SIMBA_036 TaxID=3085778 RepID=UPI00397A5832
LKFFLIMQGWLTMPSAGIFSGEMGLFCRYGRCGEVTLLQGLGVLLAQQWGSSFLPLAKTIYPFSSSRSSR